MDFEVIDFHRFLNALEAVGGARQLAENVELKNVSSWNDPIGALVVGIRQLGLSGWKPEECTAIGNELVAWQEKGLLETEGILLSSSILSLGFNMMLTKCISII